jgi:hypothetical protein
MIVRIQYCIEWGIQQRLIYLQEEAGEFDLN